MENFMERIKELRKEFGLSQQELANKMGVSRSTIAMWETGKAQPYNEMLRQLAYIFDVSTDYILGVEKPNSKLGASVPVYGDVAAGIPIDAIEDIEDYEEIDKVMARGGEYISLRIKGDSMEPRMKDGDVIIVRLQSTVENKDIAVVMIGKEEATVKQVVFHDIGISLVSTNTNYQPMFFSNKQIEELPVTFLGKVVELRAKF